MLDAIAPFLLPTGLGRVLLRSAHFPDCRNLASTFPASSLATLATGTWPAQHGIVADAWYDRATRAPVRSSPEVLLAGTLAAEAARPRMRTRAYVVGLDAWQAGLWAADSGVRQFWLSPRGVYATLGDPPDWLREFNAVNPIENRHNAKWSSPLAKAGAPALRTLTFNPDRPSEFLELYKASPLSQETQFALAARLIEEEKLGTGDTLDLVTIVAGASSLLGYEVGANDPLMREMGLALDRQMAFLLERLEAAVGEGGFNLVLTGAHGVPAAPSPAARPRMAVGGESVAASVDKALQTAGLGRVARYLYPFVYLDHPPSKDARTVREAAAHAALEHPAVAGFYTADGLCSVQDGWSERFRNSFHPRRSGDVMLSYREGYIEDYGAGRGVSYGSLYNYDARVPLCLYGASFRPGIFERPVQLVDVAPTLARVLGVAAPPSSVGRVLSEALA
ncbi:MAG: alkaline phosphatase family protein [Acidobacteriota bacterium]|nr:alkaline phosphatase family protein [Acidobacteriota bacterium]